MNTSDVTNALREEQHKALVFGAIPGPAATVIHGGPRLGDLVSFLALSPDGRLQV